MDRGRAPDEARILLRLALATPVLHAFDSSDPHRSTIVLVRRDVDGVAGYVFHSHLGCVHWTSQLKIMVKEQNEHELSAWDTSGTAPVVVVSKRPVDVA